MLIMLVCGSDRGNYLLHDAHVFGRDGAFVIQVTSLCVCVCVFMRTYVCILFPNCILIVSRVSAGWSISTVVIRR